VGGTPEVVVEGENGFLVRPEEEEAMAARIVQLLADPSLRERMGRAGRRRTEECFSPEGQAENYRRLYMEVAALRSEYIRGGRVRPWKSWRS
jgi:glycosyltransferase involved in cell wall biosynthesis